MKAIDDVAVRQGLQFEKAVDPSPFFPRHDDGIQRRSAPDGRNQ